MTIGEVKNNLVGFHINDVDFHHRLAVFVTGIFRDGQAIHDCRLEGSTAESTTVGDGITELDGFHTLYSSGFRGLSSLDLPGT